MKQQRKEFLVAVLGFSPYLKSFTVMSEGVDVYNTLTMCLGCLLHNHNLFYRLIRAAEEHDGICKTGMVLLVV